MVVWLGDTLLEVRLDTSPIPLSMLRLVAPVTLQDKVADCPADRLEGVAVNALMTGAWLGGGPLLDCHDSTAVAVPVCS